jgi:hypothetical protein
MKTRRILAAILLLTMPLFAMSFGVVQHSVMAGPHHGAEMHALGVSGGWAVAFEVGAVLACGAVGGVGGIGCGLLAIA